METSRSSIIEASPSQLATSPKKGSKDTFFEVTFIELHLFSFFSCFFNMFHQCFTYFRFTSLAHLPPSPHIGSPGICLWLLGCDHGGSCCAPNHMGPPNSLRVRSWRHPGEADRSWQNAGKPWVENDKHDIKWQKMTTWYNMLLFCCHLCRLRPFMAHCVIMVCEAFGPSVFKP